MLPGITQGTRGGGSGRAEEDGTGLAERKTNELNLTDITGFGILGHTQNLAKQQGNEVSFVIHNLPVLAKMVLRKHVWAHAWDLPRDIRRPPDLSTT